jgi:GNAT superfamily N-acetyltransferase
MIYVRQEKNFAISGNKEFSVGVLVLKLNHENRHVIDNIYIDDAYRRQGIASWLIERAFSDFPDLCLDGRFTTEGISFFGAKHRKNRRTTSLLICRRQLSEIRVFIKRRQISG